MTLLSKGNTNAKTAKIEKYLKDFEAYIMYLAPHKQNSKKINICPFATDGCSAACLYTAGRGKFNNVQQARINKTEFYLDDRVGFMAQLEKEIAAAQRRAEKKGKQVCIRLNGTSDINWISTIKKFPDIQFYDYTKNYNLAVRSLEVPNYHVTFSRSETNDLECEKALAKGINVAIVFDKVPKIYKGYKVIDGDLTDARFTDEIGVVVGLKAKGDAKKDTSGFVLHTSNHEVII